MQSQFGLSNLWQLGDTVTRAVVILLVVMSLASWTVILIKTIDVLRMRRLAARSETFWHSTDFAEGLGNLGTTRENPFRTLAEEGRDAVTPQVRG